MKPPPLRQGDTVGIFAPSSRVNKNAIENTVSLLEKRGYKVFIHPQTFTQNNQSAGTTEEKTAALHDLFAAPSIQAIICAKGGNQAGYLLDRIDYDLIRKNPKIIMGYSDPTALLNAITKETGLVTFHGPMPHNFPRLPEEQLEHCFALLAGETKELPLSGAQVIRDGQAEGPLIGGNLSLLCSLIGTPWEPDFENAILFLEDCDDEISRFDRMFQHLRNAGVFKKLNGLIFGQFTDVQDTGKIPFGLTLAELINNIVRDLDIPAVANAPFGHGPAMLTLPIGAHATLHTERLTLSEPAVQS